MSQPNHPRVSAIITTYNCQKFVSDAITSVLSQTRPVDEFIIVDDGSTDATRAALQRFSSYDIQLITQANQGPGAARNTGIRASSGDLIAFLDCDDIWLPQKIQLQADYLEERPQDSLVGAHSWWWDTYSDEWTVKQRGIPQGKNKAPEILIHNFVGNPSATMFRRELFEQVGLFNETLHWGEDWELWMRILQQHEIGFIPKPLIVYRWHSANISHERMWERFTYLENIALSQIGTYPHRIQRPFLHRRAKARWALERSWHLRSRNAPRFRQLGYLWRAFFYSPFEQFGEKFKLLISTVVGKANYGALQNFKSWLRSGYSTAQADKDLQKPDCQALLKPAPGLSYSFHSPKKAN